MALTREQAIALYAAILESKPVRQSVQGALGYGKIPGTVGDFDSHNADVLDRCEELLAHVGECTTLLEMQLRDRPRQHDFDFPEGEESEAPKKRGRRKKA